VGGSICQALITGGNGGAMAMDASNAAEKVMAQDGQYSNNGGADGLWGGAFFDDDNEDEIDYF
jgi:hypothetical protein